MAVDGCAVTFDAAMRGLGGATFHFFTARRVCIWRTMSWQDVRLSVCLSVCLSHAGIVAKPLHISFFYRRVAPPF